MTSHVIEYTIASDSRYPASDPDFGWDGSFIEHTYGVNCDATNSTTYKYEQFDATFNSPANTAQWEYLAGSTLKPRIPIQCDTCADNRPQIAHLMRPVSKLIGYNKTSGVYTLLENPAPGADGVRQYAARCLPRGREELLHPGRPVHGRSAEDVPENFVVLLTDGFETGGGNPCTVATTLGTAKVPVFVISFGTGANPVTNQCVATNSGGKAYTADNEQELVDALNDIFNQRIEVTAAFAAASVPTALTESQSTAYLAALVPQQSRAVWSGHLRAYKLDPVTGLPPADPSAGLPLQDAPDAASVADRRPLWDVARVMGQTEPLTVLAPGAAAASTASPAVTVWPGRKLVWGSAVAGTIPNLRHEFVDTLADPEWSALKTLLDQPDTVSAQRLVRFLRGNRDPKLKAAVFTDLQPGNDARSYLTRTNPSTRAQARFRPTSTSSATSSTPTRPSRPAR